MKRFPSIVELTTVVFLIVALTAGLFLLGKTHHLHVICGKEMATDAAR